MVNQNYEHFTPIMGLNFKKMKFSYQYTTILGEWGLSTQAFTLSGIGVQF